MRRSKSLRVAILTIALALLFAGGAIGNLSGAGGVAEDYARWGYPPQFRYLTGALEITALLLLLRRRVRWIGALVGLCVMTGALATLILHDEIAHAIIPALGFAACLWLLRETSKRRLT